jgi:hypothetical protein
MDWPLMYKAEQKNKLRHQVRYFVTGRAILKTRLACRFDSPEKRLVRLLLSSEALFSKGIPKGHGDFPQN